METDTVFDLLDNIQIVPDVREHSCIITLTIFSKCHPNIAVYTEGKKMIEKVEKTKNATIKVRKKGKNDNHKKIIKRRKADNIRKIRKVKKNSLVWFLCLMA